MPETPDQDLLERFVAGDQEAFEALFRQLSGEVHRWVMRIVRDESAADDVLVEAFWRAYRGRARFDPSRSFGAWLRRIATNAALDELRALRKRRAGTGTADDGIAAPAGPDGTMAQAIALAFRALPPRLQLVASLALIEERPYAEIADALSLPVGTVKSRVSRAAEALRRELARMGIRP
jgi:RNA polymerase sigma-70 factor (ECF subfamily)